MSVSYEQLIREHVQINVKEILYALENDEEFFIQFFLGDELVHKKTGKSSPVPEFHKEVFSLMVSAKASQCVFALPRDHAKTTLAKLCAVWYYLFSNYRFVVYLSNTASIAVAATNDIIAFIESENFASVFGRPHFHIKQEGVGYYKFDIMLPGGKKTCILKAHGSGQQVRGLNIDNQRPQLAIVDDLEDNDNIATEELADKLKRWFYSAFKKALDKFDNKIIQLGNMISNRCMLKEHCESQFWFSRRYGCILSNGKALWPEAFTISDLIQDFKEYKLIGLVDIWFAEMMNLPLVSGRGLIEASEIFYKPEVDPSEIEYGCITIDLAISKRDWAHHTVVTAHGWQGEHWQLCEQIGDKGIDPIELFGIVVSIAFKWNISVIGFESTAYQASLESVFDYLCLVNRVEGLTFVPLTSGSTRKVQRLAPWAGLIKKKEYALPDTDFKVTEQLLTFDPKKENNEDDYIDSAAYIVQMLDFHYMQILNSIDLQKNKAKIRNSYEVCGV